MRVAFYGMTRHTGTSANLAAVEAVLKGRAFQNFVCLKAAPVILTDCSGTDLETVFRSHDLLALNLSIPFRGLEEVYVRHSFVRRNVIYLVGKYDQSQGKELEGLIRQYRIDPSKICTIPYHQRFAKAYENQTIPAYLKSLKNVPQSYEDFEFERQLKRVMRTIITFGKGEQSYG